jgi:outer membrane immunogenic protein
MRFRAGISMRIALALSGAIGLLIASSAVAADLPTRKSAPVFEAPAAFTWTGFYFGANAGGAFSSNKFAADPLAGIAAFAANVAVVAGTGSSNSTSFTGGIQAGYNQQFSNLVLGVEGDVEYIGGRRTRDTGNLAVGGATVRDMDSMGSDWMPTVRARLGWAFDRSLIYATGGAAFADMQFSRSQNWSLDACPVVAGLNACHTGSSSNSVGWTVGGGAEYALTNNWIIRAEYLYADFGKVKFTTISNDPLIGASQTIAHSDRNSVQLARIGVDYKF